MSIFGYVYIIECKINRKLYVGITNGSIKKRWNKHIYDTRHNSQCLIHRAIRKYGIENFKINEIQTCDSRETLCAAEIYWINKLSTHVSVGGYNETFGGDAPMLGRHHTEATKEKMRNAHKGKTYRKGTGWSNETRILFKDRNKKPVAQLSKDGVIIKIYKSINEASLAVGIANSNISGVCRGKKKTAGGFGWKYIAKENIHA